MTDLISSTNSSLMKLYNLEGDFDETLRQYKQAYLNYISVLQSQKPKYSIIKNTDFPGNNLVQCQKLSPEICEGNCDITSKCFGFSYDTRNNANICYAKSSEMSPTTPVNGVDLYVKNIDLEKSILVVESLNSKLIVINQKIIDQLNEIQPNVDSIGSENKKKLEEAVTIYESLLVEKIKIEKLKNEQQTVSIENSFSQKNFTHQYSQYIFWIILFCIMFLITMKFVLFPTSEINPSRFFFWLFISSFLFVSILFLYIPSGFMIFCTILAYLSLGFLGILPLP